MTHKRLKEFFLSYIYRSSDSEETDGEYFNDKHNNALKVIEQINNKLKIIFRMLSLLSPEPY